MGMNLHTEMECIMEQVKYYDLFIKLMFTHDSFSLRVGRKMYLPLDITYPIDMAATCEYKI